MTANRDVQAEYDRAYDPRYLVPDFQRYLRWYEDESRAARQELPCSLDVRFGQGRDELLDIFPAPTPGAPIVIFVHGGYWQSSSSKDYSFVARGLRARGVTVVLTNYSLCPDVTIAEITRQTRAAVSWVHREASTFQGDRDRIFVAGHSAGGQQVGRLLATPWAADYGLPQDLIKGALTISGLFDLRPLRQCSMQHVLRLTPELAVNESPLFHVPDAGPPIIVSCGADESAEFHRQSSDYLDAWRAKGLRGQLLVQPGRNHFDALMGLSDAKSQLCEALMAVIAQTARSAGKEARSGHPDPGPPLEPAQRDGALPASLAQQRLWFLAQLPSTAQSYNEPIVLRMDELADVEVLQHCLTEIARRHEAWRTVFPVVDGVPRQRIEPPKTVQIDRVDLRSVPATERESAIHSAMAEHARRPFDLQAGPLVRALYIISAEKESRLIVTAHHAVVDGISFFNVFLPELSALYAAFSRKQPSPLPETTWHYADFSAWQRRWLTEEVLGPKLAYWRAHLANLLPLPLPTDFPRPALTWRGARMPVAISAELTRKLRELGRGAGVSLFTTLLAAWKTLLFRYAGQSDIVVGSAAAGRPRPEFEGLIGFFNHNLVLRTQLDGSLTFLELLPRVGETLRSAREHQDVPFDRLVSELGAGRSPYESPIFNNSFILMPPMPLLEQTPGWSASRPDIGAAKVDLYLELHQRPAGLSGHLEYRTDLFSADTIERMSRHFVTLLEGIASRPDARLDELSLLSEAERHQLLVTWNDTAVERPDTCIHEIFEAQVQRTPDAIALKFEGQVLTYGELNARANQLAHALKKRGVGPDVLVGVCMERSIEMVVALYGVLKAGGAYVPLDPELPRDRLAFMLDDTKVQVVLTQTHLASALPEHAAQRLCLDDGGTSLASEPAINPTRDGLSIDSLAYVIYTSGSTGSPKGAMNTHRGIQNRLLWMQRAYGLTPDDRVLQKTPFSFDVSVWEFFWPLMFGAQLVIARPGGHRDAAYQIKCIAAHGITTLHFVPSMLQAFLEAPDVERCHAVRHIVSSGEALSPELARRALTRLPAAALHNLYGPTEAAVDVTAWTCERDASQTPIGRPIDNVRIYILDARRQPVPIGVPGELYIGGIQVGRGYLNRPELTAERFIADPFDPRPKATPTPTLYRTGDLARWLPAGVIEYLGRADFQVKLRGVRIELGEIESVLEQHAAIQQARVVLHKRSQGDEQLLAYLVPDRQQAGAVRQLLQLEHQGLLRDRPRYELPNGMTILHQNKGETDFIYREIFEDKTYEKHGITLREDAVVFDVGANIGLFALYVQKRCPGSQVYAFEPIPPVFETLRLNADIHGLNAKLFACGLGSADRLAEFTYYPYNSALSSQFAHAESDRETVKTYMRNQLGAEAASSEDADAVLSKLMSAQQFSCPLKRLSDVIREQKVNHVDLLKIDVEKSELEVLLGIDREDWPKIQQLALEVHDFDGRLQQITSLLREQGYQVAIDQNRLLAHTGLYDVYARRPPVEQPGAEVAARSAPSRKQRWESPRRLLSELQNFAKLKLPAYMIPSEFVLLHELPLLQSGKVDTRALTARSALGRTPVPAEPGATSTRTAVQQVIAEIWREILAKDGIELDDSFFEIGGHSLALARVQARLRTRLGVDVDVITLLGLPTIRRLAAHIQTLPGLELPSTQEPIAPVQAATPSPELAGSLAIIGMAIRAPGVRSPEELWDVVLAGRETLSALDPEALIAAGASPARVRRPDFVPAEGVLEDADRFDAAFFGYSDADAALMDPQQRLFLECSFQALENAGCDATRTAQRIGVFGGAGAPLHWLGPVNDAVRASGSDLEALRARMLNAPDFLALRAAFKLGLRGPAVTVQTACSTSLAAVHIARQSLLAGECDVALAGGVTLSTLRDAERGYFHDKEGGHEAADGHCRPFDARASGMVKSSGVAIVVLKRLADALRDQDTIHAVVLGSAMTNDGASKIGFTAPSEDGVAATIQRAHEAAGVNPRSVGFVEAHGTGTRLGDPVEVRALTRAYRHWTEERGFCALGSVKANLGHTDSAAGAAGLIKAALSLKHGVIPPIAGFAAPNPLLDLPNTPFFVPAAAQAWPTPHGHGHGPRRASVNSIGIGGTNVHVVLEEAPVRKAVPGSRPAYVLCLSARTETALAAVVRQLSDHLERNPSLELADVAFTLALGRKQQRHRATLVYRDTAQARTALASRAKPASNAGASAVKAARPVVFLFPGHGAHYPRMGLDIYEAEPLFRAEVDRCFEIVRQDAGLAVRDFWLDELGAESTLPEAVPLIQVLIFSIEYALAKQLLAWGVRPAAMLGHSLGEYVAACIAGVFSLRDALALVVSRSRLAEQTPPGSMLVAYADPHTLEPHLEAGVTIATYAPGSVVLTGLSDVVKQTGLRLASAGIQTSLVRATRAGHSPVLRSVHGAFRQRVAAVELRPPTISIISNMTGRPMTQEQATSPDSWADHLCSPVRLEEGLGALLELEAPICIDVGPGGSLAPALKRHSRFALAKADVVGTIPDAKKRTEPSYECLLRGLGGAWELGVELDWSEFYKHEKRARIPLPVYPFEGRRFTLDTAAAARPAPAAPPAPPAPPAPAAPPTPLDTRAMELARELGVRGIDDFPGLRPRFEALCASLVLDFFTRRIGDALDKPIAVDSLQARMGILPKYAPMLRYLVGLLEREGLASRPSPEALHFQTFPSGRSAELSSRLRSDFPKAEGLIRFVTHCVGRYDDVLCGSADALGAVYPDGTNAFYMECVHHMGPPVWHVYINLACEAVLDIIASRRGKTTRILEVGAGHGSLTWPLAERLRGADVEYHFTDIGRTFLLRADAEIARKGISFMKTRRFDLNQPPAEQGLVERYDVILGLDSVHTAADLRPTLANLHALLRPGGSLILIEATRNETWAQLAAGLLPGYWDIGHQRDGFCIDLGRWESYLRSAGFSSFTGVPGNAQQRASSGYGLAIAKRALTASEPERVEAPSIAPTDHSRLARIAPARQARKEVDMTHDIPEDQAEFAEQLWKRLLGKSEIEAGADFFELGGDSLLAVQLLAELRLQSGREIKLQQFIAQPTLEGIKALLGSAREPEAISPAPTPTPTPISLKAPGPSFLIPLQPQGAKRPFFCVHPIGGSALCYAPLAKSIDPDRPFYGIQSPLLEDPAARPTSIEDMAAWYIDAIRRVQPTGPYLLGGWSFGGTIAIEMARQLRADGQRVGKLVLIDALASPSMLLTLLHRADPRWAALTMLPSLFPRSPVDTARGSEKDGISSLASVLGTAAQSIVVCDHHLSLWQRHASVEVDVPAVQFVPEKRALLSRIFLPGKPSALPIRSLRTVPVPGDHFSMISGELTGEPAGLGARIKDALDEADRAPVPAAEEGASPAAEESVRAFLGQYVGWMRNRDGALLGSVYADDCINVTTGESILMGPALMKQHYGRKMPQLSDLQIHVHDWRIRIFAGGRSACAVGLVDSDQLFTQGKRRISYRGTRVSLVLVRQADEWRVLHSHYSLPVGGKLEVLG